MQRLTAQIGVGLQDRCFREGSCVPGQAAEARPLGALVKPEERPIITAQLTDLDKRPVEIGMRVEMVTRQMRNDGDERGSGSRRCLSKITLPAEYPPGAGLDDLRQEVSWGKK